MATNVLMPKWGMAMQEGLVNCWLKKVGDAVQQGEALVEVESSKATDFVEAPASGVLARILVPEGKTVPIATVIGVIALADETVTDDGSHQRQSDAVAAPTSPPPTSPLTTTASAAQRARRRASISPAARRLALERGLDPSSLRGTGPDGMIVIEDVQAAVASAPPPVKAPISKAVFFSRGDKLDGVLYLPKDYRAGQRLPGLVFCLGYTYVKDLLVPEMARRLSAQGYACLLFDYRGFGKSDGPRGRLFPLEQVADIQAAATWLAAQPAIDAGRIGLVGISLGGAHALQAAALNERIGAVAAIAPIGDGRRWLRGARRSGEWLEFLQRIQADFASRVLGSQPAPVDAWDILAPDPTARAFLEGVLREFPDLKCALSLESAQALIDYRPESLVARISPRPMLLLHGEADLLVPIDESKQLFDHAGEPRELALVPGMGHFDWTMPQDQRFGQVMTILGRWLARHLQREQTRQS